MSRYVVLPRAETDLRDIWRYTVEHWGIEQAERYIRNIESHFQAIADNPKRGRACDEIRAGYFRVPVGSYFVFYSVNRSVVSIARILHQRRDFRRHL
jgi:toxin ParE1/3/4